MSEADLLARIEQLEARHEKLSELTLPLVLADMQAKADALNEPEADPAAQDEPTPEADPWESVVQSRDPRTWGDHVALDAQIAQKFTARAEHEPEPKPLGQLDQHLERKLYGSDTPPPAA